MELKNVPLKHIHEKLGAKIRDAQLELIPYMLVIGPRDAEQGTVSIRDRLEGDLGAMSIEAAIAKLQTEIAARTVRKTFSGIQPQNFTNARAAFITP